MMKPGTSHFDNHSRRISIRQQRSVRHSHRPLCWLLVFLLSVWVLSLVSKPEAQTLQVRSDQMSHSVVSNSLRPHGLQHGLPVHHQLSEFTQTHVHWVSDAIQPSHPLLSPSPSTLNLSQHQGLFQWVSSSHQVAKVLEFQLQHPSFQWIFRTDFL